LSNGCEVQQLAEASHDTSCDKVAVIVCCSGSNTQASVWHSSGPPHVTDGRPRLWGTYLSFSSSLCDDCILLSSWHTGLNTTIGHSACWANRLKALAGLGSNPGLQGGFSARLG